MKKSPIEWTQITGGPHLGCTEVSPGCAHCYARELTKRWYAKLIRAAYKRAGLADWETRPVWGCKAPRIRTKTFWRMAKTVNRKAEQESKMVMWFPSLIDWLDHMPSGIIDQDGTWLNVGLHLADFFQVIAETPWITWQLLSKRPELWRGTLTIAENSKSFAPAHAGHALAARWLAGDPPANVWIGTTVEDQQRADERIPRLLEIPAVVRFLSCEPLLSEVDLLTPSWNGADSLSAMTGIHWVICGGESGPGSRPMHPDWGRRLRDQCANAGVPFLFKQWGEFVPLGMVEDEITDKASSARVVALRHDGAQFGETEPHGFCCGKCSVHDVVRVGKKAAGRLLDGVEHNAFPASSF